MAYQPTLSDIAGRASDPELAKGELIPVYDNREGLRMAMEAGNNYAQNVMKKYAMFQNNLKEFYQNAQFDYTNTMPEDRDTLLKNAADFFSEISKNPSVIGNPAKNPQAFGRLNQLQGKLQSNIAKSKQDYTYGVLQEKFRQEHPDLYNPDNDNIKKQWSATPLEQRKAYNWKLPTSIDTNKLATGALVSVGKKFDTNEVEMLPTKDAQGNVVIDPITGKPQLKPTGYFLETKGTQYGKDQYNKLWNDILSSNNPVDQYGHTAAQAAEDMFRRLPAEYQQQFIEEANRKKTNPVSEFWQSVGDSYYKDKDISDTQRVEDKFAMQRQKYADDLDKMKTKFGYDRALKAMESSLTLGRQKDLAVFKDELKNKDKNDQIEWLEHFITGLELDAKSSGKATYTTSSGKQMPQYYMKASPAIKGIFAIPNPEDPKTKIYPDDIAFLEDGSVQPLFYERNKKGERVSASETGNKPVDINKSRSITREEFKALVGKQLLGINGLNRQLRYNDNDNNAKVINPDKTAPSSPQPVKIDDLRKKYNY